MNQKVISILVAILLLVSFSFSQIEQGDKEVLFAGSMTSLLGIEDYSSTTVNLYLSYAYSITSHLQLGIGPSLTYSRTSTKIYDFDPETYRIIEKDTVTTSTEFSGVAFFNLNFTTSSKTVPYIAAQWYQYDFTPEEGTKFTDYSYINFGFGFRNFLSEYAAINTSINYGFSLSKDVKSKILLFIASL